MKGALDCTVWTADSGAIQKAHTGEFVACSKNGGDVSARRGITVEDWTTGPGHGVHVWVGWKHGSKACSHDSKWAVRFACNVPTAGRAATVYV